MILKDLHIGYQGNRKQVSVFREINLSAREGELVALLGINGIGKSTLLNTITSLIPPIEGTITINNQDVTCFSKKKLAKIISYVSTRQIKESNLLARDLIGMGRHPHTGWMGQLNKKDKEAVYQAAVDVNATHLLDKPMSNLSDGERQRVMIARALAQDTPVMVLDEPTAFLDIYNRYEIIGLLRNTAWNKGKTIVYSTHDLSIASRVSDKIWLMCPGNCIEGAPEDLMLQGAYSNLLDPGKLEFDVNTGEIKYVHKNPESIYLDGPEPLITNTSAALKRLGFHPVKDNQCEKSVLILKENQKPVWQYKKNNDKFSFHSIYQLSLHLKQTKSTSNPN